MQAFPNYWRNWNCGLWNGFTTKIEDSQCYLCEPYKEICTRPQPNSPRTIKSYNRKRSLGEIWRTFGGTYEKERFIPIQITFNKMKNVKNFFFEKITPHFVLRTIHYFKRERLLHSLCTLMVGNVWLSIRSKMQWTNIVKIIVHNELKGGTHDSIVNKQMRL